MMLAHMTCQLKMQYGAAMIHLYFDAMLFVVLLSFLVVCTVV